METLFVSYPPLVKEAWRQMQGWSKTAINFPPSPARITLARINAEQVDIYRQVPPPGISIPINMVPFIINDSIPLMDNIE